LATAVPRGSRVLVGLRRNPSFWLGAGGALILVILALLAPVVAPHDPDLADRRDGLSQTGDPVGPSEKFVLGTDRLGRDELSRLLYGARTSLTVGLGANLLATAFGTIVGAVAAFAGSPVVRVRLPGRSRPLDLTIPVETVLMRVTDLALSFPALLLAIALAAVVGPSISLVILVIAAVLWAGTSRVVYGRVLVLRNSEFVDAARAVGVSGPRILFRHIMPLVTALIVVYATLGIASTVLFEAALSYLGVGVPPPTATWGSMISENISYYATDPRLVILPGLAIMATVLAFNLLGDALRDALDPHSVLL
jgi:peptide/nickel transport system permease protein